jgi:hypothetical protein
MDEEDNLPISRFVNGEGLLNSDIILRSRRHAWNANNVSKEDLKDKKSL